MGGGRERGRREWEEGGRDRERKGGKKGKMEKVCY